jgi:hypothetical protein
MNLKKCAPALGVLLAFCALAQQTRPVLQGSWIATEGPNHSYRGRWSAQFLPGNKNAAQGRWVLFNQKKDIVQEGTWSARKSAKGWRGTWSARSQKSRTVSGTWAAAELDGKTLEDMLNRTAEKQINGSWQSGRSQGNWWLGR